jgi:hypothetical protein
MATIKFSQRELLCKIVYYGPGLGGKTTNLQYIFGQVPEKYRGNLTSIDTKGDRTLFFDLLPLDYGKFRGFSVRLQLYTVPGQVIYNASRRIVLKGADGVVFVADSQVDRMDENITSINNLRDNLREYGIDWKVIPTVLQYNKRDLDPINSIAELNQALNFRNLKWFEATAVNGKGVFPTMKGITGAVIENLKRDVPQADLSSKLVRPQRPPKAPAESKTNVIKEAVKAPVRTELLTVKPRSKLEPVTPAVKKESLKPQAEKRSTGMPEQINESESKWTIKKLLSALFKWIGK